MIADGARAGLDWHASRLSFPAATTTGIPAATAAATAASSPSEVPPPRLRLITEGPAGLCWTAQSMPAITSVTLPVPSAVQHAERSARVTPLATPYVRPPMVPATWVP